MLGSRGAALGVGGLLCLIAYACAAPFEPMPLPNTPQPARGEPAIFVLDASPGTGSNGGHASIAISISDAFRTPLKGVTVVLESSVGTLTPATVVTDLAGRASAVLVAPTGPATVIGTLTTGLSSSVLVAVQPVH